MDCETGHETEMDPDSLCSSGNNNVFEAAPFNPYSASKENSFERISAEFKLIYISSTDCHISVRIKVEPHSKQNGEILGRRSRLNLYFSIPLEITGLHINNLLEVDR